jgi:hypothetical protein
MGILLAAGSNGAAALPANLSVLVDWDVFNTAALDWLRRYLGDVAITGEGGAWAWAANLTDTTRRQVVDEIDNWVRSGDALPSLQSKLAPLFGDARAARIAMTETTRIFAEGNLMAWKASGTARAKRWMTAVTDVCPICIEMHGTIVDIEADWKFTGEMRAANPELDKALSNLKADAFRAPPAHVNCRCWLQPVVIRAYEPEELDKQRFENKRFWEVDAG